MDERQKQILTFVINEYIKSAQPVGSTLLTEKSGLELSPATFRSELATLESEGYLAQPHTSAGRVPTENAYRFYVENNLSRLSLKSDSANEFKLKLKKELEVNDLLRDIAKQLVEHTNEIAVIVATEDNQTYYTGLSHLFSQPEFSEQNKIVELSNVVDNLDKVIDKVFDQVSDLEILIGQSNPFGSNCSAIVGKYNLKNYGKGIFAILGPMRMDYKKNIALLSTVKKLIENL